MKFSSSTTNHMRTVFLTYLLTFSSPSWSQQLSPNPQPVTGAATSTAPTAPFLSSAPQAVNSGGIPGLKSSEVLSRDLQAPVAKRPSDKTTPGAIEKANRNVTQVLFVEFEQNDVLDREDQRRKAKNRRTNDDEIELETRREYRRIREEVLPNGRLGGVKVLQASDVVPTAQVQVDNASDLTRLLTHPRVKAIYEDKAYQPYLTESLPLIGQPGAIAQGKNGAGGTVAVIDDTLNPYNFACKYGYETADQLHPSARYWPAVGTQNCQIKVWKNFAPPNTETLSSYHGDHVSAIAGNVAPGAGLIWLGAGYKSGTFQGMTWSTISAALEWAIANARAYNIRAINLSFGDTAPLATGYCPWTRYWAYFDRLRKNDVIPVAAVGNHGVKNALPEPACAPNVVSVGTVWDQSLDNFRQDWPGACVETNPRVYDVSCSSNSSPTVTLLAPGAAIRWTTIGYSGSSQAAPHVAGAIAVLRAPNAFPNETIETTVTRMTASGRPIRDPRSGITTPLLNLSAALAYAPQSYTPASFSIQSIINSIILGE